MNVEIAFIRIHIELFNLRFFILLASGFLLSSVNHILKLKIIYPCSSVVNKGKFYTLSTSSLAI